MKQKSDVDEEMDYPSSGKKPSSILFCPLIGIFDGKPTCVGVCQVFNKLSPKGFSRDDVGALCMLATTAGNVFK